MNEINSGMNSHIFIRKNHCIPLTIFKNHIYLLYRQELR